MLAGWEESPSRAMVKSSFRAGWDEAAAPRCKLGRLSCHFEWFRLPELPESGFTTCSSFAASVLASLEDPILLQRAALLHSNGLPVHNTADLAMTVCMLLCRLRIVREQPLNNLEFRQLSVWLDSSQLTSIIKEALSSIYSMLISINNLSANTRN